MRTSFFISSLTLATVLMMALSSCKGCKDPAPRPDPEYGNMRVQFTYVWGNDQQPFQLEKTYVQPRTGDTLTFSMFRYFVSNIKLQRADGTWWEQPDSYFLLNAQSRDESACIIKDVPVDNYTTMQYTMGVDSAKNTLGANTGALSLSTGMYWDWNSGYVMLKAEGTSPNSSVNVFAFHLGGFMGEYNVVTTRTLDMNGKKITISKDNTTEIDMVANPADLWYSAPSVSIKSDIHAPGPQAKTMALDFYSRISLAGIK